MRGLRRRPLDILLIRCGPTKARCPAKEADIERIVVLLVCHSQSCDVSTPVQTQQWKSLSGPRCLPSRPSSQKVSKLKIYLSGQSLSCFGGENRTPDIFYDL